MITPDSISSLIPTKSNKLTSLFTATLAILATSCAAQASPVENFGQDLQGLQNAFNQKKVHVLQLGDSHTAGDFLTDQLRKRLQQDIGDGGLGFAYPMAVKGQRVARHGYDVTGWRLSNSRFDKNEDYPLGGMVATSSSSSGRLTVTSQYYNNDQQQARIVVKGLSGQSIKISDANGTRELPLSTSGWQTINTPIVFPYTIQADAGTKVGGAWINKGTGGTVSALGINGATQSYWQRWHSQLPQDLAASEADLVILAYGTNEAFQSNADDQKQITKQAIATVRQGLPSASILVLGAPESLKSTGGSCGTRATSLDNVQSQLRQAAQESGVLYWSWEEAMGGRCSMKSWISQGLGASDGVHFTRSGYERTANILYSDLKQLLSSSNGLGSKLSHIPSFSNSTPNIVPATPSVSNEANSLLKDSSTVTIRPVK
ncbi:GDSL-type esterase/lipase family protein [Psychrobacter sp. FDAARGOS_221]|uniref:GDSL-type esterase/lipase family protein n=1 Tax=Psychrobacter sp. FDAARGOS_221 TaxID=1975705 RepID=UPI000BB534F8|nr:GDSL-type esterase/lipase family protein [Psychrobacter sp. FDAARGOS_221]PNK60049.1 hypothetical protein A6J60_003590 [Psychrobacter sp. FDAARGOS_221]